MCTEYNRHILAPVVEICSLKRGELGCVGVCLVCSVAIALFSLDILLVCNEGATLFLRNQAAEYPGNEILVINIFIHI